ncbi:KAR4 [Candida pseudojiufengensis]|uniref:KAR4 n=1 Tax=Candida pseudojiufengensis TaxID=497109 RepID=UPI0022250360|nr:KAR4 [Candida pseudojiufengensis]KAI5966731.1 KAR4 [Candida pseudojiufengensis]
MYTYNKFGTRSTTSNVNKVSKTPSSSSLSSLNSSIVKKENKKDFISSSTNQNLQPINYNNNYIHTGQYATNFVRNVINPLDGYPKLQRLHQLKKEQIAKHATKPFGVRCPTNKIVSTLNQWIDEYDLKFDVIMIGALTENQFILPILEKLPLNKLCSKPGFLFIWSTSQKIKELTLLLNNENFNKKFRRSEELVFLPINEKSPYYPNSSDIDDHKFNLFEKQQWHCWMCITGTVRRSTDNDLIHCNIDTDLQIENYQETSKRGKEACPNQMYQIAENFSNSNKRLHIIPSNLGPDTHVKLRPGWVIMGPDVMLNNFDPIKYNEQLSLKSFIKYKQNNNTSINGRNVGDELIRNGSNGQSIQYLVPQTDEIEDLRPKSPINQGKTTK